MAARNMIHDIHECASAELDNDLPDAELTIQKEPPTKKYKQSFKHGAADRQLYDSRNLKALDKKLNEWFQLTKCPTVALTLVGDKICYSGPLKFKQFALNSEVQKAFTAVVLKQLTIEDADTTRKELPIIVLPDDWRDFNVYAKRKLVIALVTNNGAKRPNWKKNTARPIWWPENIPFGDPNNSKPRFTAEELHSIIASYSSFTVSRASPLVLDRDKNSAVGGVGEERRSFDDDGDTEFDDDGKDIDSGDGGSQNDNIQNDNVGDGGCCVPGIDVDVDDDNANGDVINSNDGGMEVGGNCSERIRDDDSLCDAVIGMKNVLSKCTLYDADDQLTIQRYLKTVSTWKDFVSCCKEVQRRERLQLWNVLPIEQQNFTQIDDVEKRVRCQVPQRILKQGWEPVKIQGDGNCLFRSISKVLTGTEDKHLAVKLLVVLHGCLEEQTFKKDIYKLLDNDLDVFLHTITEDAILKKIDRGWPEEEKFTFVYREEIMRTVIDGRYSGYLQVVILADWLNRGIIQHCTAPGMDLYNEEVIPVSTLSDTSPIRILWCSLTCSSERNHIVPLQQCKEGEFNTFSKSFDCVCAAGVFCQYEKDLESGKKAKWIACDCCLLWFHLHCVMFRPRKLPSKWCCGCTVSDDELSACHINLTTEDIENFCTDTNIQAFIEDIMKGKIRSWRFNYFVDGSFKSLRRSYGIVIDSQETIEHLIDKVKRILKRRDSWPKHIERSSDNFVRLTMDVLMPEITAWMMSSTSRVSRLRSEEVHDKFNPH